MSRKQDVAKEVMRRVRQSERDRAARSIGWNAQTPGTAQSVVLGAPLIFPVSWFSTGTDVNSRLRNTIFPKHLDVDAEFYPATPNSLPGGTIVRMVVVQQFITSSDRSSDSYYPPLGKIFVFNTPGVNTPFNPTFAGKFGDGSYKILADISKVLGTDYIDPGGPSLANGEAVVHLKTSIPLKGEITYSGQGAGGDVANMGHIFIIALVDTSVAIDFYYEYCLVYENDS